MRYAVLLLMAGMLLGCGGGHAKPHEETLTEHFVWYDYTDRKSIGGYTLNCGYLVHYDNWDHWTAYVDHQDRSREFRTKEEAAKWIESTYCKP